MTNEQYDVINVYCVGDRHNNPTGKILSALKAGGIQCTGFFTTFQSSQAIVQLSYDKVENPLPKESKLYSTLKDINFKKLTINQNDK